MKLLVFSDTHRETEPMLHAVRLEQPDTVIHLGDHAADAEDLDREFPILPIVKVRGNCDRFGSEEPEEVLPQWRGIRILATHGHRHGVKSGLLRLQYAAMEKGADIALFGHTHCPYCEQFDDLWLMNPGACGGYRPTYGVILIENDTVSCCVKEVSL